VEGAQDASTSPSLVLAIVTSLVDGVNSILQTEESYWFSAIWKLCWDVVKVLWPLIKAVWARSHPVKVLNVDDGYVDRVLCDAVMQYMRSMFAIFRVASRSHL
jgi:hypothetical protein